VVVPYIRRGFALLCVVGMVAWLLVDVLYQDANGLVPGAAASLPLTVTQRLRQDLACQQKCEALAFNCFVVRSLLRVTC
jgi:hypothetical protein